MEAFDAPAYWPPAWLPDALAAPPSVAVLRMASAGYATRPGDDPPSTVYPPRLMGDVALEQNALGALGAGGLLALTVGEARLWDADDALAGLDRYGTADGRAAVLRVLPVADSRATDFGQPFTAAAVAWRGLVGSVARDAGRLARLALVDVSERLNRPLQPTTYAGTGGLEGGDDLKGKPKPVALGRCFNVEPVFLGSVDLGAGALPTYQLHWRAVEEIAAVRMRGVAQALVGGTPLVGQARAWPALGLVQLGGSADGTLRCDVRGDAVGGFVSTTASVLRRLLQSLGAALPADAFDATVWAFAENDLQGEIGWYRGAEAVTVAQAAEQIVRGAGAILAGGRGGLFRLFDPLARDAAQFDLTGPMILDCRPVPLPSALRPLPPTVTVAWRPNWSPISDAAPTAADRQRLADAASGPERAVSLPTLARQAIQREFALPGLYWSQADAAARAARWSAWIEAGPRVFEVTTDRYLGQVECGHIGRLFYPAYGLAGGVLGTVLGWREELAARRLTLTIVTLPE